MPNNGTETAKFRITIPYRETGIGDTDVTVTDLLNEKQLDSGRPEAIEAEIPAGMLGVYLVTMQKK